MICKATKLCFRLGSCATAPRIWSLAALLGISLTAIPSAAADADAMRHCAGLEDAHLRLQCYDGIAGRRSTVPVASPNDRAASAAATTAPPAPFSDTHSTPSLLGARWAFGAEESGSLRGIHPHKESYLLPVRWSSRVNNEPFSPFFAAVPNRSLGLDDVEAKYQISFKYRVLESEDRRHAVWAAYTQQSHWQVYNGDISRPFRETNYEPELIYTIKPDVNLAGMKWRLLNIGYVHQSNGQGSLLSRSWDRVYVQAGVEHGDVALLGRLWHRLKESPGKDDNPDITRYMGHGDIEGVWRIGNHRLTALARYNPRTDKGAMQLGWSFPLFGSARGYIQYFNGFGDSLIDYNFRKQALGVGIMLFDKL